VKGIYQVKCLINNKIYVGSSIDVETRWKQHVWSLNSKTHPNAHLQGSWNEYGKDAFKFSLLEEVNEENILFIRERHWIIEKNSLDRRIGYNMRPGSKMKRSEQPLFQLLDEHHQIILGTLLGNAFICGKDKCYLSFQHSDKYKDYFLSKAATLESYGRKTAIYKKNNTWIWRSQINQIWYKLRALCYKEDKKYISEEWLYPLRAIALAIWYCDSGCLIGYKKRNACLRTQSFGLSGNLLINSYFNEIGAECNIRKLKKAPIIVFTVKGTEKFLKIVAPFVHGSLLDKLTRY